MFSHISWKQVSVKIPLHLHIFGLKHRFDSAIEQVGFPGGSDGKESACNMRDLDLMPGVERSPGGEHGNPPQFSCLENPHRQRSLAGYSPQGLKESDTTELLSTHNSGQAASEMKGEERRKRHAW